MNKIAVFITLLLTLSISIDNIYARENTEFDEKIIQKENQLGEQLDIVNIAKIGFELIEKEVNDIKIQGKKSGKIYGITIDENHNDVDINSLEDQEINAYKKRYGKLTRELYNELQEKKDTDKIRVGIWLSPNNINNVNIEGENELERSMTEHASIEAPVISEIKINKGKIIYASDGAPLIYAELSKKDINKLQNRPDVEVIDKEGIAKPEINSAIPTIKANLVWPYVTGSGVKVAVVEDDGIAFANPYIRDGIYYKPYDPYIDNEHATMVAGIIQSTHSTYKGVAPGVSLLSANSGDYYESSLIAASDWARNKGANIFSLSWGIERDGRLHIMDKYYDYIATRYPYPTITKSAGNTAGRITTPGNGWNVIATGAIDDQNTAAWPGDSMAGYSAYIDPISPHNDREKPEIAAVGSRIKSTSTSSPWITPFESAGTSFAGPAVAGTAALIMSKNATLKNRPEVIRAIIFASAIHNIEGSSRLSEKDGMGGIVASEAYKIVANKQFRNKIIYSTNSYPIKFTFNVPSAGKKVRVAISWNSKSAGPYGVDSLKVDLDLKVKSPSSYVGTSASYDNNYEIVEFTAPVPGTYTAEIYKRRWDSGHPSERIGLAYYIS